MSKRRSRWHAPQRTQHNAYVWEEKVVGPQQHNALRRQKTETKEGDVEATLILENIVDGGHVEGEPSTNRRRVYLTEWAG